MGAAERAGICVMIHMGESPRALATERWKVLGAGCGLMMRGLRPEQKFRRLHRLGHLGVWVQSEQSKLAKTIALKGE